MADQFYYEEGYIESGYHAYIAEAEITIGGAFTPSLSGNIAPTTGYYIPDYVEEGYYVAGIIHEASASISVQADASATATRIQDSKTVMSVTALVGSYGFDLNNVETGVIRGFEADITAVASQSSSVGAIRGASITLSGVFSPTIQILATRGGDVDLYTQFAAVTEADRSRDTDVTLQTLINLSLQNDRLRASSSNLSVSFGETSVEAARTRAIDSSLAVSFDTNIDPIIVANVDASEIESCNATLFCEAERYRFVDFEVDISDEDANNQSVNTSLYANPISWSPTAPTRTVSVVVNDAPIYDNIDITTSTKKFGSGSVRKDYTGDQRKLSEIFWDGSNWVILNNDENVKYTSTDLSTWTTTAMNDNLSDIAVYPSNITYGADGYIDAQNTTVYYSSNGLDWNEKTNTWSSFPARSPTSPYKLAQKYGKIWTYRTNTEARFLIHYTTLSGSTWSGFDYSAGTGWTAAAHGYNDYGNRLSFAFSSYQTYGNFSNRIYYTTNGTTMTYLPLNTPGGNDDWRLSGVEGATFCFDGTYYYYIMSNYSTGQYAIMRSDGTTSARYTTNNTIRDINYVNGYFYININEVVYRTTTPGSNHTAVTFGNNTNVPTYEIKYLNNTYVYFDRSRQGYGDVWSSTDGLSWTNNGVVSELVDIDYHGIEYTNSDFNSWKTIDFWARIQQPASGLVHIPLSVGSWGFSFSQLTHTSPPLFYINNYDGSISYLELDARNWLHYRIQRSGSTHKVWVNGQYAGSTTNSGSSDSVLRLFDGITFDSYSLSEWIDELRVSDQYLNDWNATSIDVPTQPWTNTADTLLLAHFDTDYADDANGNALIIPEADISAAFSVSANVGTIADATTLQVSSGTLTADVNVITDTDSTQSSAFSIDNVLPGYLKDSEITAEAIATSLSVAYRVADFFVDCDSAFIATTDAVKTARTDSTQSSAFSISADVNEIVQLEADLSSAFNASIDPSGSIIRTDAVLASYSGVSTHGTRIKQLEANAAFAASLQADAVKAVETSASADVAFILSADNSRTRNSSVELDGIASTLTAAVKVGDFLVDCDNQFSLSVDPVAIPSGSVVAEADFAVSANAVKTTRTDSTVASVITLEADGTTNITADASISTATTLEVDPIAIVDVVVSIQGAASFNTTVRATRPGDVDLYVDVALTADCGVIKQAESAQTAQSTLAINAGINRNTSSSMSSAITLEADGRLVVFLEELVYVVPPEIREFAIHSESREHTIHRENREFTIQGA